MGSIADNSGGGSYLYRSSKVAVNMVVKSLAIDLKPIGITAVVFHPGWVKTDMGGPNALISAEQSVSGIRQVIARLTIADSGKFFGYDGQDDSLVIKPEFRILFYEVAGSRCMAGAWFHDACRVSFASSVSICGAR